MLSVVQRGSFHNCSCVGMLLNGLRFAREHLEHLLLKVPSTVQAAQYVGASFLCLQCRPVGCVHLSRIWDHLPIEIYV